MPSLSDRRESLFLALRRTAMVLQFKYLGRGNKTILALEELIRTGGMPLYRERENDYITLSLPFSGSIAPSRTNPRQIEFMDAKTGRLKSSRPATFLKSITKAHNLGEVLRQDDFEIIATVLGEQLPSTWSIRFEFAEGGEVKEVYANTMHTCMTRSPALAFYQHNYPNVRVMKIIRDGNLFGRAIVWKIIHPQYSHYVDRVYPSSGAHINAVAHYARQNNWLVRDSHSAERPTPSEDDKIITVPLKTAKDEWASNHSHGGFPYMDSFTCMKHSPDHSEVMLATPNLPGFVSIGYIRTNYRDLAYCPIARGWYHEMGMVLARVINKDGSFRAENRFHLATLRRTHTLIMHPNQESDNRFPLRVYAPNEMQDEFLRDTTKGITFLRKHAVETRNGELLYVHDVIKLHDGTYIRQQGNLRRIARLPNGEFVLRSEAKWNAGRREWELRDGG
jgi:hypothetical protein